MAASVTIHFEVDAKTGKRTITIRYQSDPGALPMEHEEEHRELVEKLIEGGLIAASEAGHVIIERETAGASSTEPDREREPERQAVEQES